MIDGSFRENVFGADYFLNQDFDKNEFEVIWVEFYLKASEKLPQHNNLRVITLNNSEDKEYHSSFCFNEGIKQAQGELILIPDADQIVAPDFLSKIWSYHKANECLVGYVYRYDEISRGSLATYDIQELERKCVLKNTSNYGGCLSVRKKWLMEINGYEQNIIFKSGFHANGLDIYTRFKNLGMPIKWFTDLKLYHPWHPSTRTAAPQYEIQRRIINWRSRTLQYMAIEGIEPEQNAFNLLKTGEQQMISDAMNCIKQLKSKTTLAWRIKYKAKRFYSLLFMR